MLEQIEKTLKTLKWFSSAFLVLTTVFWVFLCIGSWQDKIRVNVPGQGNGCAEFDLNMPIGGYIYSPDPDVITKYSNGYFLLNRGSFDFETQRNGQKIEGGTAVVWMNPFNLSFTIYYKIQKVGEILTNDFREDKGLRFEWQSQKCS